MSILCTETMNLSDLLKKQEMLQCVTNAPEGSLYWPRSLAVTLNTAKEPESCTGH